MTTREIHSAQPFAPPQPQYSQVDEQAFRRAAFEAIQKATTRKDVNLPMYDITDFGSSVGKGYEDTAAIAAAITEVDAAGGGQLLFPDGVFLVGADVDCPRTVLPVGLGGDKSTIKSTDGTQRRFRVTGTTTSAADYHLISGLVFDAVSVDYGATQDDQGRGCAIAFCDLLNSDRAIYYGYHTYNTKIIGCNFRLNTTHVYYDFATVGSDAGAHMCISDSVLSECSGQALYMNGSTADGYHLYLTNIITDNSARFLTAVNVLTDGIISLKNISFELISDCFIYNDGAHILVDGFMALSVSENYWLHNVSGTVQFRNGRGAWNANKFARMDGGIVVVDQASIWSNLPWWGENASPFAHASSTGGRVIAPRSVYRGRASSVAGNFLLTDGSPVDATTRIAEPFDYNDRVIEFYVVCSTAGATDNTLRVQLADGGASPFIDLVFPLVDGGAHVRVTWRRGANFAVEATYAPSVAGNAQFLSGSVSDTTTLSATKFLAFTTAKAGATASQIAVWHLHEDISGTKSSEL